MANSSLNDSGNTQQPSWPWMLRSPARIVAFGLGSGLLRPGPGTWGTLVGWLLWVLLVSRLHDGAVALVLLGSFAYGCFICHRVGRELGQADHGGMVWDEIVAIWLVLWLTPSGWLAQLAAVALFRVFDIFKPPPVRWFDARIKNGFGVMLDDIIAAAYALLVLAVLTRLGWLIQG